MENKRDRILRLIIITSNGSISKGTIVFLRVRLEALPRAACPQLPTGHQKERMHLLLSESEEPARADELVYIQTCVFSTQRTDRHVHSRQPILF
jgi:hypothetical protein